MASANRPTSRDGSEASSATLEFDEPPATPATCDVLFTATSRGSFYVWPPVGGYWTHTSTTCSSPSKLVLLHHHFDHVWSVDALRVQNSSEEPGRIAWFEQRWIGMVRKLIELPRRRKQGRLPRGLRGRVGVL